VADTPKILIVDDDPIFLDIVSIMVQHLGYLAITAADGLEALELFREHTESIVWVFLDINMPKMDGISTLRYIRNICKNTKVVMVSGTLNNKICAQLSQLCPFACLDKPISFECISNVLSLASIH